MTVYLEPGDFKRYLSPGYIYIKDTVPLTAFAIFLPQQFVQHQYQNTLPITMASVKAALALLALGAFTTAGPLQERQADVCESGVYRTLIPLFEANSMAQVYCSAARPACTTAGNEKRWMPASTTIDATTPPTTKHARELLPRTSWSGTGSSNSSMSSPDATALAWVALVEDQPDDVVATLCSCIGDYAVSVPCINSIRMIIKTRD